MDTFTQKLKAGLQGEEIARVYLESLGHKVEDHKGPFDLRELRLSDFLVNGAHTEVKLDILSAKTGNIVIEHQSLITHTAPYYIYILPTFYKTTKDKLQLLVDTWPDKVSMGDDGRQGTKVKIDSETFRQNFTRL
jgi:hypothetical protein